QPCQPYVTPSLISSFGRRLSIAHIAEGKSVKNSGENTICQSSVRRNSHLLSTVPLERQEGNVHPHWRWSVDDDDASMIDSAHRAGSVYDLPVDTGIVLTELAHFISGLNAPI
ncbi:hypothetical protein, partial [Bradyrhizobium vignae]|uniref:hypothetical protein n=1 Tax=Bradyrhizobium vignae TaxID=1549949 RepID=UPI001ABFCCC2